MCIWDDAEVANSFSAKGCLFPYSPSNICWESRAQHFVLELPGGTSLPIEVLRES